MLPLPLPLPLLLLLLLLLLTMAQSLMLSLLLQLLESHFWAVPDAAAAASDWLPGCCGCPLHHRPAEGPWRAVQRAARTPITQAATAAAAAASSMMLSQTSR
jgi:hypothetical protein